MRAPFGDGMFATVTSWIVGFVIAVVFGGRVVLPTTTAAIAILAGANGYAIGAAAWGIIGNEQGVIVFFVIGLVVGVVFAIGVLALNVPRYLVIVLTGLGGAATVIAGLVCSLHGSGGQRHVVAGGQADQRQLVYLIVWGLLAAAGSLRRCALRRWAPTPTSSTATTAYS